MCCVPTFFVCCYRTVPNPSLLESKMIRTGLFFLKCFVSVIFCNSFFIVCIAFSCSSSHFHSLFLLRSGRSGAQIFAKLGMNRLIWFSVPNSDGNSYSAVGLCRSEIAWMFSSISSTHIQVLFLLAFSYNEDIISEGEVVANFEKQVVQDFLKFG